MITKTIHLRSWNRITPKYTIDSMDWLCFHI